jgi:hypothetical protein
MQPCFTAPVRIDIAIEAEIGGLVILDYGLDGFLAQLRLEWLKICKAFPPSSKRSRRSGSNRPVALVRRARAAAPPPPALRRLRLASFHVMAAA